MTDKITTIILGGGASLGAHQVGALKYLEEQGTRPTRLIGSSIGVINAMAYATGGIDHMEKMWNEIVSLPVLLRPSLKANAILGHSLFDAKPFYKKIESYFDYEKVWKSDLEVAFVVTNMTRCREEMMTNHQMTALDQFQAMIRAAVTIPVLYPLVPWKDQEYCDGGFGWNIPLEYAVERGADEVYVLSAIATKLPRMERVGRSLPTVLLRFLSLLWRNAGNSSALNARMENGRFHNVPTTLVFPREELSGFTHIHLLNVTPKKSRALIAAGYEDAQRQIARQSRKSRRAGKTGAEEPTE